MIPVFFLPSMSCASMGPQLYRCGNLAGGSGPRREAAASMGPQLYRCGNGRNRAIIRERFSASMGPQLYRCGNASEGSSGSIFCSTLQWGRNFIVAEMRRRVLLVQSSVQRFNGAATLSLRKYAYAFIFGETALALQWGRNFIVAEICRCNRRPGSRCHRFNGAATLSLRKWPDTQYTLWHGNNASMGPQLYRCGNPARVSETATCRTSFNGAATLSLRKCSGPAWFSLRRYPASMGPQLYRCGNYE